VDLDAPEHTRGRTESACETQRPARCPLTRGLGTHGVGRLPRRAATFGLTAWGSPAPGLAARRPLFGCATLDGSRDDRSRETWTPRRPRASSGMS
jgi:hypothetical protein